MGATLHRGAGTALHRGARAFLYRGPSRRGAQAPDAQAQQLWLTGPVAPRHVGSSQTRARTRVPCIGRQTLNHCATREALAVVFYQDVCLTTHISQPKIIYNLASPPPLQSYFPRAEWLSPRLQSSARP